MDKKRGKKVSIFTQCCGCCIKSRHEDDNAKVEGTTEAIRVTKTEEITITKQEKVSPPIQEKDKLIKSILNQYLEFKMREKTALTQTEGDFSDTSSESDHRLNYCNFTNSIKNLATKSKSTPTTNKLYDSLTDICLKMGHQQQDKNEEASNYNNRKLELIFTESDEMVFSPSLVSLQYNISCGGTPVITGTLKTDSGCQIPEDNPSQLISQELFLDPVEKHGDTRGITDESTNCSSASLKWKLIISHHHGDH